MKRAVTFLAILSSIALSSVLGGGCSSDDGPGTVASADGVSIAYESRGTGAPALVFVHGWSIDRSYWSNQMDSFGSDHQVVAIDLAGHGESGLEREEWTMESYAGDVVAVIEALDLQDVVLIGHSMSGLVVSEAGRLLGDRVRALIAVDTLHDVQEVYPEEQVAGFIGALEADFPTTTEGFVRSMFPAGADTALVAEIAEDMAAAPPEVAIPTMRNLLTWRAADALGAYRPIVHCINAPSFPANVDAGRAHTSEFVVHVLPDVGHFLFREDPQAFDDKLREVLSIIPAGS